eukprot:scaffold1726_cov260-Pinguiococcus_pyrenoidosus.AAC.19
MHRQHPHESLQLSSAAAPVLRAEGVHGEHLQALRHARLDEAAKGLPSRLVAAQPIPQLALSIAAVAVHNHRHMANGRLWTQRLENFAPAGPPLLRPQRQHLQSGLLQAGA